MGVFARKDGAGIEQGRQTRLSLMVADHESSFSTQRCGRCGISFVAPSQPFEIFTIEIGRWFLDVGGYCSHCGVYICDEHTVFVRVPGSCAGPRAPAQSMTWSIGCAECLKPIDLGPMAKERGKIIVDASGIFGTDDEQGLS